MYVLKCSKGVAGSHCHCSCVRTHTRVQLGCCLIYWPPCMPGHQATPHQVLLDLFRIHIMQPMEKLTAVLRCRPPGTVYDQLDGSSLSSTVMLATVDSA